MQSFSKKEADCLAVCLISKLSKNLFDRSHFEAVFHKLYLGAYPGFFLGVLKILFSRQFFPDLIIKNFREGDAQAPLAPP